MCRFNSAALAAVAAFGLASIASAADLPTKGPVYKAPVTVPPYSWTGFYVGGNAGYGWGNTSGSIAALDPASATFLGGGIWFTPDQFDSSIHQSGAILGAQAGYNWQFSSNWVGGFETDIQYAGVRGSKSNVIFLNPGAFGTTFPFATDFERKLEWFGTVRGRLGFLATPDLLFYGTAGLAYGETKASGNVTNVTVGNTINILGGGGNLTCVGPATCYSGSSSRTSLGWTAGAGFEYHVFGNVTAKLEYLHVDLGGQTVTLTSPPPSSPGVATTYSFNREAIDIVRAGLNYKFN